MPPKRLYPKSDADYLKKPCHCPFCDSSQIEADGVEVNEGTALQEVSCNTCDAEWTDHYRLEGYDSTMCPVNPY